MGLDLMVEGCAKPGHDAEWRRLVASSGLTDAEKARFREISIPPHERVGAPRVGQDDRANAWIFEARGAVSPEQKAAVLKEFNGYYALQLVECDGLPEYSHGGLYEGVDETSFRGSALEFCGDVLEKPVIDQAWSNKMPEDAVAYGRQLLAAADAAEARGAPAPKPAKKGLFAKLGLGGKPPEAEPFEEQLDIVRACGRWYVFWGERGHAITAWY